MIEQEMRDLVRRSIRYDQVKETLIGLAQQESPETHLWEQEPKLLAFIREYVQPHLRRFGMPHVQIDGMGNLISHLGPAGGPSLLFLSHAMNHAPEGMPDPYSGAVVDGTPYGIGGECVWGRGVSEQKGGMAAMLAVVAALLRERVPLRGRLLFGVSTAGECGRHDSVAHMVHQAGMRADLAVMGIGTGNEIGLGNKGRFNLLIKVTGKPCHVSRPWLGVNAVDGAMEIIRRVQAIPAPGVHPALGPATITVQGIYSEPYNTSTVPGVCHISVDRRLLPGDDLEATIADMKARIGTLEGYGLEMEVSTYQYPAEITQSAASAQLLAQGTRAVLSREAVSFYNPSALDAGYLQREGIETVQYGPGDMQFAHTPAEVISVQETWEAARVLMYAALRHLS